jgi:inhibitor of KinA sporulation pathway (predicted exonuclease)
MENQEQKTTTTLFSELNKTIQVVGVEKLVDILKHIRKKSVEITQEQVDQSEIIITTVCEEFAISLDEFYSHKRLNDRRYAVGVCALLLQNKVGLDNSDISFLLRKPADIVSIYKNSINLLRDVRPDDLKILKRITNINSKLKDLQNE